MLQTALTLGLQRHYIAHSSAVAQAPTKKHSQTDTSKSHNAFCQATLVFHCERMQHWQLQYFHKQCKFQGSPIPLIRWALINYLFMPMSQSSRDYPILSDRQKYSVLGNK